jgi:hypothetical protein
MTRAMFDVPRCLDVEHVHVGDPAVAQTRSEGWREAWGTRARQGGTREFRRRVVQECLDTVAVLRSYREPLEGETWMTPGDSEQRLLAQVNAILGLGPAALEQVAGLALDDDLPDPGRVFAALFVLSCAGGERWLPVMRRLFVAAVERNPQEAGAAVEAMGLGPHAGIDALMAPLLEDPGARLRASAVRVLAFRGTLGEAAWARAMRDDAGGTLSAALNAPLHGYDDRVCERALQPWLGSDSEVLVRLMLRAGAGLRLPCTRALAAGLAQRDPAWADSAHALALHADLADAPRLQAMLHGPGGGHAVRAAGVLGSVSLVEPLLAMIEEPEVPPPVAALAQRALWSIAGLPAGDPKQARAAWGQRADAFRADARYRVGQPFHPAVLVGLLKRPEATRAARQDWYLELAGATAWRIPRFSPHDFVGVQHHGLRRLDDWVASSASRRNPAIALH